MKKSVFKILLIAPALVVSSCGYGLKEVYSGIPYNTTDFFKNYYNVWNDNINPYKEGNKITVLKDSYELDETKDKVFRRLSDANFKDCDDSWSTYAYTYDKVEPDDGTKAYGPAVKLSSYDSSFKYGVTSKMFDGQMFCNGDYANARTQVKPMNQDQDDSQGGFGVLFSKESNDASYFMMNFKCSVVLKDNQNLSGARSNLKLKLGLFMRNETGYTYQPLTYTIDNIPTNSGDDHSAPPFSMRNDMYVCFGFSLKNFDTDRLVGFSVQYEKISDTYSETNPDQTTYHAIMLYEVSFPKTTWH